MYNIQKAVSRLDFAPKLKEIQITDIQKGIGVFTPKPDKPVSFAQLKETLKKAGYVMDKAVITVRGTLARDDQGWAIVVESSGQRLLLQGSNVDQTLDGLATKSSVEITGNWKTDGSPAREIIIPSSTKRAAIKSRPGIDLVPSRLAVFAQARFVASPGDSMSREVEESSAPKPIPAAPIRVTSPGLTVYKGGAVTPRLYLIKQHLGNLNVNRQILNLSLSYTPSPRLQLEVEAPFSHTDFKSGATSGSGSGFGNVTLWSKYRFFRKVKTYGDRQAAFRFGLELPTGKSTAPTQTQINAPAFVRQQLTPINGGTSAHFDVAFSQAGGRFIFGGNAEGIVRAERAGYRMGHEIRIETDTEYVLLPRNYKAPGHELFVILETTFVHRATGRLNGNPVAGSNSTEYYLAPGLQYAAAPRFVIEASFQFPLVRNTGPFVLRNDRNILLGVKYLF